MIEAKLHMKMDGPTSYQMKGLDFIVWKNMNSWQIESDHLLLDWSCFLNPKENVAAIEVDLKSTGI